MADNRYYHGLSNVHYSVVTETTDSKTGEVATTYGTVKAWKGAVGISFDSEASLDNFFADNGVYAVTSKNSGYTGSLEIAQIPDDVYTDVYGQTKSTDGLITETDTDVKKYIALMFEFATDTQARRVCFYKVALSLPTVEGNTDEDTIEVQTRTLDLTAVPRPDDGKIKTFTTVDATAYATFYNAVPVAA